MAPLLAIVASPRTPASSEGEACGLEPPPDGDASSIVGRTGDPSGPPLDMPPTPSPGDATDAAAAAPPVSPELAAVAPSRAQAASGAQTTASANRANRLATRKERTCSVRLELIGPSAAGAVESRMHP